MVYDPRSGLDQLLPKRRQRPVFDVAGEDKSTQEAGEIVGQREELKPHRIVEEAVAGEPRPFERVLALLDPLFGGSATVVEPNDIRCVSCEIGHDKTHSREQRTGVPLHLCHDPPRTIPTLGLILKARVVDLWPLRRASHPAFEQVPDITVSLEEREPGGPGIHLVRNMMDEVSYRRRTNKNVVILVKHLEAGIAV